MFNKNRNKKINKVFEFLDNKGFYIVLLVCVGVITLTAFMVTKRNIVSYMEDNSFDELVENSKKPLVADKRLTLDNIKNEEQKNISIDVNDNKLKSEIALDVLKSSVKASTKEKVGINELEDLKDAENIKEENSEEKDNIPVIAEEKQRKIIALAMPVQGKIIKDFAMDNLVYSKTLEQWTTHDGIDITSSRGTPVKAAYDGIVTKVYKDIRYGITIVIEHEDGIETNYSNLSTDEMVKVGLQVKKGDVISGVGNTALYESGEQPHIHFEVIDNGQNVNPGEYLK